MMIIQQRLLLWIVKAAAAAAKTECGVRSLTMCLPFIHSFIYSFKLNAAVTRARDMKTG